MQVASNYYRSLASRISVVLVDTVYSGNIGSVARSMRNFGVEDLRLVHPRATLDDDTLRMAMHSADIVEKSQDFDTLEEALEGFDVRIGTTRRIGRRRWRYVNPAQMSEAIIGIEPDSRVALVFGPEDFGLSNEHLALCNWILTIPGGSEFESLNLSHAVTVVLYDIHRRCHEVNDAETGAASMLEGFFIHFEKALRRIGFILDARDTRRTMLAIRRMVARGKWNRSEINLFHALLTHIESNWPGNMPE